MGKRICTCDLTEGRHPETLLCLWKQLRDQSFILKSLVISEIQEVVKTFMKGNKHTMNGWDLNKHPIVSDISLTMKGVRFKEPFIKWLEDTLSEPSAIHMNSDFLKDALIACTLTDAQGVKHTYKDLSWNSDGTFNLQVKDEYGQYKTWFSCSLSGFKYEDYQDESIKVLMEMSINPTMILQD